MKETKNIITFDGVTLDVNWTEPIVIEAAYECYKCGGITHNINIKESELKKHKHCNCNTNKYDN